MGNPGYNRCDIFARVSRDDTKDAVADWARLRHTIDNPGVFKLLQVPNPGRVGSS